MLCPCWVKKMVNKTETVFTNGKATGNHKVKREDTLICGRKPAVLVQAHYGRLLSYRQNEGKLVDVFGMCAEHGAEFLNPKRWAERDDGRQGAAVSGQRGTVDRVEIIDSSSFSFDLEAKAREDKNLRKIAAIKSNIKRQMNQRNAQDLTVDHWRQAFSEILDEWIIEQVMDS